MSLSTSPLSFTDCYTTFDMALSDPLGIRIKMPDYNSSVNYRMRLHMARTLDRKRNSEIYRPGDPMYGVSQYDRLKISIKTDGAGQWVILQKTSKVSGNIYSLSTGEVVEPVDEPVEGPMVEDFDLPVMEE